MKNTFRELFKKLFGKKQEVEKKPYYPVQIGNSKIKRKLYEKYIGDIPDGYIVVAKDGNPNNIAISNLEAISRKEQLSRNLKTKNNATKNNK
jgi:hypothetical protein